MNLTWPQLLAYLDLNSTLDRIEQANDLWITAMGAQGDGQTIGQSLKELANG